MRAICIAVFLTVQAAAVNDTHDYASLIANVTPGSNGTVKHCACPGNATLTEEGCCQGEELFLGLCYKKCASFDGGNYPHRTAPNICCKSDDFLSCFNKNMTVYDQVPGPWGYGQGIEGGAAQPYCSASDSCRCDVMTTSGCCPDEENWLGLCYKKCTLLTNGTHPHRCWPNTCSSEPGFTSCFNGDNLKSEGFGPTGYGVDKDGSYAKIPCYTDYLIGASSPTETMSSMVVFGMILASFW